MKERTDSLRPPPTEYERRLQLVMGAMPHAALLVDAAGRITMTNGKAEQKFGYLVGELRAMSVDTLLPDGWSSTHGRCKDGSPVAIEVERTSFDVDGAPLVLVSIVDPSVRNDRSAPAVIGQPNATDRTYDAVPFSVIATDADGIVLSVNAAAVALLCRSSDELIGRPLSAIDSGRSRFTDRLRETLAARSGTESERDYLRGDGTSVPVNEGISPLYGADGLTTGYVVAAYDITKHRQAQSAVLFMASHDPLTNLPNRSMLVRRLVNEINRAKSDDMQVALVLLDLDHFKRINDSLGHHAGDVLLLGVAERIKRWAPDGAVVARLGGDEFVILLTNVVDIPSLTASLEQLLLDLRAPLEIQGTEVSITASAGGVLGPRDADGPSSLLRLADTAMYHAKAMGRNGFVWFAEPMLEDSSQRASLASELRHALQSEQLSVAYQPQVDLKTGQVIGFEALARWHGRNGPVRPDVFIPVAEESGMIVELGAWVLERACQDLARMQRLLDRPLRVAVNCSPRQLQSVGWVETVFGALDRACLSPGQLELEITEGVLMDERWNVLDVLRTLRSRGISIAIDDFGQGYSSLAYLARFPIDKLKIDKAFIQRIDSGAHQAPIVDAIIGMAHALNMQVIAEGVENEHQARYLLSHGCGQAQGFLYAAAMPAPEVAPQVQYPSIA